MALAIPIINEPDSGRGLNRIELEQLTPLLLASTSSHSSRYRTLAHFSRFCSDQHVSALPISQLLVRDYLETQVLRTDVSPWVARIVLGQLKEAFDDINSIIRSSERWDEASFAHLLEEHDRDWQRSEADRLACLEVDDEPALLPANTMSEDEQSDTGSASGRRQLRARRTKKLSSPELVIQTRRAAAAVGMKRGRSAQSPAPYKRQRLESPGLLSPLSAPENVLFGSDARADPVHPNVRRSSRRMAAQDSDSDLSPAPSEPSSPISKAADPTSSSQSDRTLQLPPRNERARSEDSSSVVDYERYEDDDAPSPISSLADIQELNMGTGKDFIGFDDEEREQTPVPPAGEEKKKVAEDFVAFESSDVDG